MSVRLGQMARDLVEAKDVRDRDKQVASSSERHYRRLEASFWDELDRQDGKPKTVKFEDLFGDGKRVTLTRRETIRGRIFDPEAAAAALAASGRDDEIFHEHRAVRGKVLNEAVRDMLEAGEKLPDGIDFSATRYVMVTRPDG